jgi:hypothetical protein
VSHSYTPRRAGKRWREGAPDYVLDCIDDRGEGDRYTVLMVPFEKGKRYAETWVPYVGVSEYGNWHSGDLEAHQTAQYRYRNHHKRVRWSDLPEPVQRAARDFYERED